MKREIGFLLPKSVIYPTINFDLVAGLRLGLQSSSITDVQITTASIGIAGDDKLIYARCEKMLMDDIRIVVAYINPITAEKLSPLFESGNALLIALDAGYHYPSKLIKLPNVFFLSLQGALCCRMITKIAVNDGAKKIAYAGSFYESGYRSAYAFYKCMDEEGGSITYNHITQLSRKDFSLAPLTEHLKTASVDAVFASFCGDMLQDFYAAAGRENIFSRHPVYGSPFMAEEQWLAKTPYPGIEVKTCIPWAAALDNQENQEFKTWMSGNDQRANIFSLLGWEAARLVAAIKDSNTQQAITCLEGFTFNSPRGKVTVSAANHRSNAPVYEAVVQENKMTGNCLLAGVMESALTAEQHQKLENDIQTVEGSFTSWLNAYPCLES
jgi:branched-chain amino acid transport system substrate-binding protein